MSTSITYHDQNSNILTPSREVETPHGRLCVVQRSTLLWEVNNGDVCGWRCFPCGSEAAANKFVNEFRGWQ